MPLEKMTYEYVGYEFKNRLNATKEIEGIEFATKNPIGFIVPALDVKNLDNSPSVDFKQVFMTIKSPGRIIFDNVDLHTLRQISTQNGGGFIPFPEGYLAEQKEISFTASEALTGKFHIYIVGTEVC
jgi:hypothetical protein